MTADEAGYSELLAKIERERGFRGNLYRQSCLRRRVDVRMRARGATDPAEYADLLDADPDEYERLLRVLTINVSKFFRNPETWSVIRTRVMPELLGRGEPLVLWSAGSAAGEEAYSLAILAWQWRAARGYADLDGIRIVGTDIDATSLENARAAVYPEAALSETPPALRRRWFENGAVWRLKEPIRSLVQFRRLDLLSDRPDFDADLILCRNLLIYLDRRAQERVFKMFVEHMKPGGYLVLGRVEMLSTWVRSRFEVVDGRERIYKRL